MPESSAFLLYFLSFRETKELSEIPFRYASNFYLWQKRQQSIVQHEPRSFHLGLRIVVLSVVVVEVL